MTNLFKLKNQYDMDVYSIDVIDKSDNTLTVSTLLPVVNIFDTLTVYDENNDNICKINMSEIFINSLIEAIEKNTNNEKIVNKVGSRNVVQNKIQFREPQECFPCLSTLTKLNEMANLSYVDPEGYRIDGKKYGAKAEEPKVGVNEMCPCGSGKKYKKCCGIGE